MPRPRPRRQPVYATKGALERARRDLPGVVLENAVATAMGEGRTRPHASSALKVHLGEALAIVRRDESEFTGRPCWLVVHLMEVDRW